MDGHIVAALQQLLQGHGGHAQLLGGGFIDHGIVGQHLEAEARHLFGHSLGDPAEAYQT